ncbi:FFLEELY motif protein [Psychrobacter sp. I-STPA6b]|uniref:FFLEELY motif protein n=1 Tax=Psychrobacter sp. I-STPA6b TaxID=2585718 RepID=UPI001D0C2ADC|nr:hypothetical protein [Psychrobacter sp. I-STPA6b]
MSSLSDLQVHLSHFWQLPYHQDSALEQKLNDVQAWQRQRMAHSHEALFSQPQNQAMAHYFMYQLYGGEDFKTLATQLERIVPKAQKLEKLAPASALETGTLGIQAAITAIELDMHIAQWLLAHDLTVNEENMLKAYQGVNEAQERQAQIHSLKDICYRIDKYLNSFMLQKAFQLAKGTAYKYNYQPLYDFIASGFSAMKPLKSVSDFIEPFCERELAIIEHVHEPNPAQYQGKVDPFGV